MTLQTFKRKLKHFYEVLTVMFVTAKVSHFRENVKYDPRFKSFNAKSTVLGKVHACGHEWLLLSIM